MEGKKNIVFGFLFLVITASLGPYMALNLLPDADDATQAKKQQLSTLQLIASSDFENPETLDDMTAEEIAKINSQAILAMNTALNARVRIDGIKGGPHAHGNLESLLNIALGLLLGFLTISSIWKQLISWTFIIGTLAHSGMAFLSIFGVSWAAIVLNSGVGPVLVLSGFLMAGLATWFSFKR